MDDTTLSPEAIPEVSIEERTSIASELPRRVAALWLASALGFGWFAHWLQWNAWGMDYGWHVAARRLAAGLVWVLALAFAKVRMARGTRVLWALFGVFALAFALYDSPLVLIWAWLAALLVEGFALEGYASGPKVWAPWDWALRAQ